MVLSIEELDKHISAHIQGVFGRGDMALMKQEIERLGAGDVYVEIGVNEGRSARVAHEYADPLVYKIYIDIADVDPVEGITIGRGKWMEQEGMVGIGKRGFYVHGDADEFANLLSPNFISIDLLFIDGHHDYESVKKNTLMWEPYVSFTGTILFHDTDDPNVVRWLDEHYGVGKWENINSKIGRVKK